MRSITHTTFLLSEYPYLEDLHKDAYKTFCKVRDTCKGWEKEFRPSREAVLSSPALTVEYNTWVLRQYMLTMTETACEEHW